MNGRANEWLSEWVNNGLTDSGKVPENTQAKQLNATASVSWALRCSLLFRRPNNWRTMVECGSKFNANVSVPQLMDAIRFALNKCTRSLHFNEPPTTDNLYHRRVTCGLRTDGQSMCVISQQHCTAWGQVSRVDGRHRRLCATNESRYRCTVQLLLVRRIANRIGCGEWNGRIVLIECGLAPHAFGQPCGWDIFAVTVYCVNSLAIILQLKHVSTCYMTFIVICGLIRGGDALTAKKSCH